MRATRRELLKLSAETRLEAPSLEKLLRLGDLLDGIAEHPLLAPALVLKGGTALNLFFGAPTRLSVDLDFNYIGKLERSDMLQDRAVIEEAVERVVTARGYALQRSVDAHAGRTFHLSYRRMADGLSDRIALDINFLHRICLLQPRPRRMWQPGSPNGGPRFPILSFDELSAGKLIALLDRAPLEDPAELARVKVDPDLGTVVWPNGADLDPYVARVGSFWSGTGTWCSGDEEDRCARPWP